MRWWDGCVREVMGSRKGGRRASDRKVATVLLLEDGHETLAPAGPCKPPRYAVCMVCVLAKENA